MNDRDAARQARIDALVEARAKANRPAPSVCVTCGKPSVCREGGDPVCNRHRRSGMAARIAALEAQLVNRSEESS